MESRNMMNIVVRLFSGKQSVFEMPEDSTILDLKNQVSSVFNIEEKNLFLLYHSEFLPDEATIKSINYIQGDSFIIAGNSLYIDQNLIDPPHDKEKAKTKENTGKNSAFFATRLNHPPQKDSKGNSIPWNYEELVSYITHLGYPIEYVHHALEFTNYDLHRAIFLLATGKATGPDGRERSCNIILNAANDTANAYGIYPIATQDAGNSSNDTVGLYSTYDEPEEPEKVVVVPIRRTEEERKLDETMKNFTEEERQAITRLSAGRDLSIVVQVFMACDKDEILTENCLSTMN